MVVLTQPDSLLRGPLTQHSGRFSLWVTGAVKMELPLLFLLSLCAFPCVFMVLVSVLH